MDFTKPSFERSINIIKLAVKNMPAKPGIYKMTAKNGKILYIGKAKNLPKRVISYSRIEQMPNRLKRMVSEIDSISYEITNTEAEALLLESGLIKTHKPPFNILLRDDKSYPYIWIDTSHQYPRITKFRGVPKNSKDYWGPFASASSVNNTIVQLQRIFKIRPCSDSFFASRSRPCLEYQIHRCSGPCANKISPENYNQNIENAKNFLNGKSSIIHDKLQKQMWDFANNHQYEKAASIRDKINVLSQIQNKNIFNSNSIAFADIIAIAKVADVVCIQILLVRNRQNFGSKTYFPNNAEDASLEQVLHNFLGLMYQSHVPAKAIYTNIKPDQAELLTTALAKLHKIKVKFTTPIRGDKKDIVNFVEENAKNSAIRKISSSKNTKAKLQSLQKLFALQHEINRVEIYDNSHISGTDAKGAYVVYTKQGFERSQYRHFNIRFNQPKTGGDDYAMLRETLERRLKRLDASNYPDILLIDGGKGHLSTAHQVLDAFNIKDILLVCISKGPDRNSGREFLHIKNQPPFQLPIGDTTLKFLQMLRDEVHNYVINKHRDKRVSNIKHSALDDIPSIGKIRKVKLLQHFGSAEQLKNASVADIERVQGFNKKIAKIIYNHLHLSDDN